MEAGVVRDIAALVVPRIGRVVDGMDARVSFRVVDAAGRDVPAVSEFLREMAACDASPATLRSYSYELLGWLRFLAAVEVTWDRATRAEAREYAVATRRHARTVVHAFYEYHRTVHGSPLLNPFPATRHGGDGQVNVHHNPMRPWLRSSGPAPYQPKAPRRIPRAIPDEQFNELFAALASDRDRELLAFWISTGARARELLTVAEGRVDPASQLIGVVRKGSRALQMLPASADAFVWLRLYQHRLDDQVPRGPDAPLWWTLRRPVRPLAYDAARMMFGRAQDVLGSNWSLHDLRHSAAYRMANDPGMSVVDRCAWPRTHWTSTRDIPGSRTPVNWS